MNLLNLWTSLVKVAIACGLGHIYKKKSNWAFMQDVGGQAGN
jgi:hypothetical protein